MTTLDIKEIIDLCAEILEEKPNYDFTIDEAELKTYIEVQNGEFLQQTSDPLDNCCTF